MKKSLFVISFFSFLSLNAQNKEATITGNIESTFQYLNADSLIGATQPDSKGLLNSYMNIFAAKGNFRAGMRLESYLPRIQGYPNQFDGTGIGMRYVAYGNDFIDVTLGSIYEQFGSGLSLRVYEDRALGYDNFLDGMRLIVRPNKGVVLKGVYGKQRLSFRNGQIVTADGIVRGIDASVNLNQLFKKLEGKKLDVTLGGSFVSKYQADNNDTLILPLNVATYGGRIDMKYGKFSLNAEYVHKINDPSSDNQFIYNTGHAALVNFSYSRKGLGILLSGKSVDNMSFRSDRSQILQDVLINFLPAMNRTHTYNLVASLYPYATQPLGEIAFQAELIYTLPKDKDWGKKLGGKYGTTISLNYSSAYRPMQHSVSTYSRDTALVTYSSRLFDLSDSLYWQDINVSITRKFSKKFNMILNYYNISINNDVAKITGDAKGIINTNIGVIEAQYKINKKHSIRTEAQLLLTKKDKGNWGTLVVEYNIGSNWFLGVMDQYNYGNPDEHLKLHYIIGTVGYVKESTRFTVSYGKQRAGLFCVGGVCRFVPASNGLTFTFTHSF
ncbi:MAG: DUF6029 family protein [Flavobacteriia bacterium]|jgi:hypothetical protein